MEDPAGGAPGRIRDIRVYRPSFFGMALLVCTPFLILGAAPVYGAVALTVLLVVWVVLFALGCRWFMRRPWRVLGVAVLSMLCWLGVVLVASAVG
jgi:hypothetical protein